MRKTPLIGLLAVLALASAAAACSSAPTASTASISKPAGFVDSTLTNSLDDRGDSLVSNARTGWNR